MVIGNFSNQAPNLIPPERLYQRTSPNDTAVTGEPLPSRDVLLVKGTSWLENAVARVLCDSLDKKGFYVTVIQTASLGNRNPSNFCATIIFNGIKGSGLSGPVKEYTRTLGQTPSNVLICTVYGERWNGGNARVDAVAAATRSLNPASVASRILAAFSSLAGER